MAIKGKVGRPAVRRSEDLAKRIRSYAAVGVPASDIAKTCGMSEPVLRRLYGEELATAGIEANAQVAGMLYKQCQEGNTTAIIFWLKTRARWSETAPVDDNNEPIAPIRVVIERRSARKHDAVPE